MNFKVAHSGQFSQSNFGQLLTFGVLQLLAMLKRFMLEVLFSSYPLSFVDEIDSVADNVHSISNLGMFQVDNFCAIINPPQVFLPFQYHNILRLLVVFVMIMMICYLSSISDM